MVFNIKITFKMADSYFIHECANFINNLSAIMTLLIKVLSLKIKKLDAKKK